MEYIGILLFFIGASGMDNKNVAVPAVMVLIGLAILTVTAIKENSLV
jgi:hypothetical protein